MISSKESKHPEIVELIKTRILGFMTATTYVTVHKTNFLLILQIFLYVIYAIFLFLYVNIRLLLLLFYL